MSSEVRTQLGTRFRAKLGSSVGGPVGTLRDNIRNRARWPSRALAALVGKRPKRLSVQIQTASFCDGKCLMCPYSTSWHKQNPGCMSDELFETIIRQLEPMELERLCLYLENEPLLDRHVFDRLWMARNRLRFACFNFATNAATLTADKAQQLVEVFEGTEHRIWIGFHGVDEASYRRVMGLDFHKTLQNVIGLLRLAQRRGLKIIIRGAGLPLPPGRKTSPVHFSQQQMHDFWTRVCGENGIRRPPLNYFAYHDRAGSVTSAGYNFNYKRKSLLGFYCDRGDQWLHVLYNGKVIFCCNDYHCKTVIGDLGSQSVAEVLESPAYRDYRLKMMGWRKSSDDFLCKRCVKPGG